MKSIKHTTITIALLAALTLSNTACLPENFWQELGASTLTSASGRVVETALDAVFDDEG